MFDDDTWGNPNGQANRSIDDELDEFFSGGGGPKAISWKDAKVGASITGVILKVDLRDKLNKKTNAPELNAYGKPKKVLILTLATDMRDPEIEGDEGYRRAFLQGNAQWEFKNFLRTNGFAKPLKGGRFKQTLVGTKPTEHYNDQNLFQCLYADPTAETLAVVARYEASNNQTAVAGGDFAPARGASTLETMRASGNAGFEDRAPF